MWAAPAFISPPRTWRRPIRVSTASLLGLSIGGREATSVRPERDRRCRCQDPDESGYGGEGLAANGGRGRAWFNVAGFRRRAPCSPKTSVAAYEICGADRDRGAAALGARAGTQAADGRSGEVGDAVRGAGLGGSGGSVSRVAVQSSRTAVRPLSVRRHSRWSAWAALERCSIHPRSSSCCR
jgi:hypothetical protein